MPYLFLYLSLDPFANGKKNVAKSLTTASVFQYIMDRFHDALKYFGIPQNSKALGQTSPDGSGNNSPKESGDVGPDGIGSEGQSGEDRVSAGSTLDVGKDDCDTAADIGAKLAEMVLSEVESEETGAVGTSEEGTQNSGREATLSSEAISGTDDERTLDTSQKSDSGADGNDPNSLSSDTSMPSHQDAKGAARSDNSVTSAFINELDKSSGNIDSAATGDKVSDASIRQNKGDVVDDEDFVFTFDKQILTRGEAVQVICTSCLKEGHVSKVGLKFFLFLSILLQVCSLTLKSHINTCSCLCELQVLSLPILSELFCVPFSNMMCRILF